MPSDQLQGMIGEPVDRWTTIAVGNTTAQDGAWNSAPKASRPRDAGRWQSRRVTKERIGRELLKELKAVSEGRALKQCRLASQ
jgi:hypothetical protein